MIRCAIIEKKHCQEALCEFLRNYRATPHPSTGVAPNVLFFGRNISSRFPSFDSDNAVLSEEMRLAKRNDAKSKAKAKTYTDKKKRAKLHDWKVGDIVYAKQRRTSKFMTYFSEKELKITDIKFSMISVRDPVSGKEFTRDRSHFIKKKEEDLGLKFIDLNDESSQDPNKSTNVEAGTNETEENKVVPIVPESNSDSTNVEVRRSNRIKKPIDRLGYSH